MNSVTIGNVEVTPVLDTGILMDPDVFMPAHAAEMRAELADRLDERGLLPMSVTTYLIRSNGRTILVDSGLGGRRRPQFPRGHLPEMLKRAGVTPEEIDCVVHTHLHVDHVGWNTVDDEKGGIAIFFPRAEFVIQQTEWDYWMTDERLHAEGNAHLRECVAPLNDAGRIRFVTGEAALDESLTFVPTPGHTPGHVAIGIYSAGQRAVIVGDASHHPSQLLHPDWSPAFDVDPLLSARTRARLFDEAAADGRIWMAGHWEFPGVGRIVGLEGRRVFQGLA